MTDPCDQAVELWYSITGKVATNPKIARIRKNNLPNNHSLEPSDFLDHKTNGGNAVFKLEGLEFCWARNNSQGQEEQSHIEDY